MAAAAAAHSKVDQVCQVQLSFKCQNLRNTDVTSKTDPFCKVETEESPGRWVELGRTETQKDMLHPTFVQSVIVDYYFERVQKLRFSVMDSDGKDDRKADLVGTMECLLTELLRAPVKRDLTHEKHRRNGLLIVTAETLSECADTLDFTFWVDPKDKLPRMDMIGGCDGYVRMYRQDESGVWTPVWESNVVSKSRTPTWNEVRDYPVRELCNGDYYRPIKIEVWDSDGDPRDYVKDDYIGEFTFTLNDLKGGRKEMSFPVVYSLEGDPKHKHKKKNGEKQATIWLRSEVRQQATFTQFLQAGTELNFVVAVDFTASNGDVNDASSLHYCRPGSMNQYEQGMQQAGEVLSQYDTDGLIPAYGFGATLGSAPTSHMFALTGDEDNANVKGVQGLLQTYRQFLQSVQSGENSLSGPTIFEEVLQTIGAFASPARNERPGARYTVLMIFTDGAITDLDKSIAAITKASDSPLSVIIVGIGSADFKSMKRLDDIPGVKRDIVQFAASNDHPNVTELCATLLKEVPEQMLKWMTLNGVTPESLRK